jgi:hypothetical protein
LGVGTNAPTGIVQIKTTQANTNGSIVFANNNASTIVSITDTGSALTPLQFRGSNFGFVDGSGVLIGGGYGDTPTARLQIKGSGSTSATTSLLVQNSAGSNAFRVLDDGAVQVSEFIRPTDGTTNSFLRLSNATGTTMQYSGGFVRVNPNFTFGSTTLGTILEMSSTTGKFLLGGGTQDASSKMQLNSTTEGFLPPRMTTTQKNAIATPAAGLVVYDSTTNKLCCYNGSTWNDLF